MEEFDVIVVGAGIGGLCAAIELAHAGLRVHVVEAASGVGGKAGTAEVDGVEFDTGPSILTLPQIFQDLFQRTGRRLQDYVELVQPEPAFRYLYADGTTLDLHHRREQTLASVESVFGAESRGEFESYLAYAEKIWAAAAPHFVFADAPSWSTLFAPSWGRLRSLSQIDPFSTMEGTIVERVASPHLRKLLARFATYNGSDVRKAPATLSCIAHVELGLGGFGVRGGMMQLTRALEAVCLELAVSFQFGAAVDEVLAVSGTARGVSLSSGEQLGASQVVLNADYGAVRRGQLLVPHQPSAGEPVLSMSAYCGVLRATRRERAGHTVLFPEDYRLEFVDIFDRGRVPQDPAIYLCAQEVSHGREGWANEEPVFVMVNAPPVSLTHHDVDEEVLQTQILTKLRAHGLASESDTFVWWRSPDDLARRFPGSDGALYGAASNGKSAAFRRPGNRVSGLKGVYLASGSAHPGGGVPLVAQSGCKAAQLALQDRLALQERSAS